MTPFSHLTRDQKIEAIARLLCEQDGLDWNAQFDPMTSGSGELDGQGYLSSVAAVLNLVEDASS